MNKKFTGLISEIAKVAIFCFIIIWGINYFTAKKDTSSETSTPGQSFRAPTSFDEIKPLNREVDFLDKKIKTEKEVTLIETSLCEYSFSNFGAVLDGITFKNYKGKNDFPLETVKPKNIYEREETSFLLALEKETPFLYKKVSEEEGIESASVTFEAQTDEWVIRKKFTVEQEGYEIKVDLSFEKRKSSSSSITPRMIFASPFLGEIHEDPVNGILLDIDGKSLKKVSPEEEVDMGWKTPVIFGGEDKYFLHALTKISQENFVKRGFFKRTSPSSLLTMIECEEIDDNKEVSLSFYVGPKILKYLEDVDPRLRGALSLGWFSNIGRWLLLLLEFLFSLLGNYGLAIIILALLVKIPLTPLSIYARKKMIAYQEFNKKYQPVMDKIKIKYKDDARRQQEEIMKLFRQNNISPASVFVAFLPILANIPILFALWGILGNHLHLYQAPFMLWITDLSVKDPYYILIAGMGLSTMWSQALSSGGGGGKQQQFTGVMMTIVMVALFANLPAGLSLYWFTNGLLTVAEEYGRKWLS